jgi:dihydrofolate reductase
MGKVFIHATITLDGYIADKNHSVDWMSDLEATDEDYAVVRETTKNIGAVVGGSNKSQTIEEDEQPYGGDLKVPVFEMTHDAHEAIEKNGTTYTFVVNDIAKAIAMAKESAGDKNVALLGGTISRQCLRMSLVDEIILDVEPLLLGEGVSLFDGLGEKVKLERVETSAFASEVHLRYRVIKE